MRPATCTQAAAVAAIVFATFFTTNGFAQSSSPSPGERVAQVRDPSTATESIIQLRRDQLQGPMVPREPLRESAPRRPSEPSRGGNDAALNESSGSTKPVDPKESSTQR